MVHAPRQRAEEGVEALPGGQAGLPAGTEGAAFQNAGHRPANGSVSSGDLPDSGGALSLDLLEACPSVL